MTYFVSDIHGEYDLFLKLLDKIGFSDGDILYVLGDMIDKGKQSVKLVDYIRRKPNIKAIVGNHEFDFLKYYYRLMKSLQDGDDANAVLSKLQAYFRTVRTGCRGKRWIILKVCRFISKPPTLSACTQVWKRMKSES